MDDTPLLSRHNTEAILALATALLLSFPSAKHTITSLKGRPIKKTTGVYEDQDGKSTPEDVAKFSTRTPKSLIAVFAATGCATSLYLFALDVAGAPQFILTNNWLYSVTWVS